MAAELKLKILMDAVERVSAPFKRATQSTNTLKAALKSATDNVRNLEKASANIEAFGRLKEQSRANATALAAAQQKAQAMGKELAGTDNASRRAQAAFKRAREEVNRLERAQINLASETAIMRRRLGEAGIDTKHLASAQRQLKHDLDAARLAAKNESQALGAVIAKTEALAKARAKLNSAQAMQGKLAMNGAVGLAAGGGVLAAGAPILNAGGDFEHKLASYGLTAGQAGDELAAVRFRLRDLSDQVNQSSLDLLAGQNILVGKGMNPDSALAAIGDVGKAATATGAALSDMSNLAFSVMDNLKVPQTELARVFDIMAKAGDMGGFELKNMAAQFPQLTSKAQELGIVGAKGAASLAASLQIAMKGAADPAEAANNMNNFLKAFVGEEAVKNFQQKGIDIKAALQKGILAGEDPIETMMKLVGKGIGVDLEKEMSDTVAQGLDPKAAAERVLSRFNLSELFGDAQAQNYLSPMLANMPKYRQIRDEAMDSLGNIDRKFAEMMKTNVEAKRGLGIATADLMEGVGNLMLPVMTPLINGLATVVRGIDAFATSNPNLTRTIVVVVGALAGLIAAGGAITLAMASVLGPFAIARFALAAIGIQGGIAAGAMAVLKMAFGGIAAAASGLFPALIAGIRAVGLAFMMNPIGLIITGIIGAMALLYATFEPFEKLVDGVFSKIKGIFGFADKAPALADKLGGGISTTPRPALKIATAATAATIAAGPALAATPAMAAPTTNLGGVTINVYAQPGQDADAIAKQVRIEIEKLEARRRAEARGRLYDAEK